MIRKYHNHKPQTTLWAARKSHSTITRHQEDKLSKATSFLFPIKMISILVTNYHFHTPCSKTFTHILTNCIFTHSVTSYFNCQSPGLEVIKLEFILRLKIKHNDWLLADMWPQAANHCALFILSLRLYSSFITSRPGKH